MLRVTVTGANGFIGRNLLLELGRHGHQAVAVVRDLKSVAKLPCEAMDWANLDQALSGADAIVHLAGYPVPSSRWSKRVRERILDSRTQGTRRIVESLARIPESSRPRTLLSMSALGYYGDCGDELLTEASPPGRGFLSGVVQAWESEAQAAEKLGVRVITLRTGVVLGRDGGALQKMLPMALGAAQKWMSWIHLEDVVRMILFCLYRPELNGAFNAVAPHPVRGDEFTARLAHATGRRVWLRVPGFMARLVLDSCRALPRRAQESGFIFKYSTVEEALLSFFPAPQFAAPRSEAGEPT